jgi:protein TonB
MTVLATAVGFSRHEALRWGGCFTVVLLAHCAAAFALLGSQKASEFDAGAPVVMLELAEAVAAPAAPPTDLAPGPPEPEVEERPPPKEEAKRPEAEALLPEPEPPKPEPPIEMKPPTAAPSVEMPPSDAAPPTPGTDVKTRRLSIIRWQSALAAHLERHKPSSARARGEQGTVRIAFTIDRDGRLVTSQIVQSSGSAMLDRETLDMLARAQPMPKPPGEVGERDLSFVVPVRFNIK